jgi:RimJ/RimL family protein N-acetyltransferase
MAPPTYIIKTDRLILRPLLPEHVGHLEAILSEPDVVKTLLGDTSTPEAVRAYAEAWIVEPSFWEAHHFGYWGVFDRTGQLGVTAALVGLVGANEPHPEMGEGPEIDYFMAPHVWGKGIGSEAVRGLCDYLFGNVGLPALEALVFAELNPASVRLAEKVGMRFVGRLPLVGHHLTEQRARETMEFDIWRVRQASAQRAKEALSEAAFRIGQLLAEGVWSRKEATLALIDASNRAGLDGKIEDQDVNDFINARIMEGIEAKGVSQYRVRRGEYSVNR